ncbi:ABC transporter permease [Actinomadura macrotermitis]|uniref:Putative 2-aminoethylphosphonate transport system permease protein PhnV n=1 Tax=Actinomadura macrotermitis TaxID=2585200 RepID=A0A7K0BYN9_9ACTN|nr:ABC transporter permease subunit [Actinomadura macrotermitis]MQY06300.1 putative 2-aminoethylphosphonate transport system permease protein PhnV [Actinomadura macrotermitis]
MLIWTRRGRAALRTAFAALFALVILAPLAVVVLAAFARSWNGVLPGAYTTGHLRESLTDDRLAALLVSLQTALAAGLLAVLVGTWGALAVASAPRLLARVADTLLHLPIAVSSVVVGLSMLVAFNKPPLLLGGTRWIVIAAHTVLVTAFAYSTVSAALKRLDPAYAQVAGSLGAAPPRVLFRIVLPLLMPAMSAAAALSIALSLGEVGATIMVYPPDWRTLPVGVFTLTDRGRVFPAAALTLTLLATALVTLTGLGRLGRRPGAR